jgi:hypothetical protein
MSHVLPHQDVLLVLGTAPADHETEERGTRIRPESFFRDDRLDKIRSHFGVVAGKSF